MQVAWNEDEDTDLSKFQDWERECIREAISVLENEDDFAPLPEAYDINQYEIISDFCYAVQDDKLSAICVI
ncbi:MAG: hypothetical protein SCK29_00960 [Bacillota bacterium]|nr:hypothetical protein [Bacillota bacterium]MDW7682670.1 hypothetical protein [Bacillota bacterium]